MKTNKKTNTSEVRAEQVTNVSTQPAEAIYLGVDLHKATICVTRIIDRSTPQPAQNFNWDQFWRFLGKQLPLAKKVYAVYEAGAFGFWVQRKLKELGVEAYVVHPEKLDPRNKKVQTDRLDARHLADKLQRYVLGNRYAMVPVYVPTLAEEQQRLEARHRRHLAGELQSLRARGRGLLLSQGIFETTGWWREAAWRQLQPRLCPELEQALGDLRVVAAEIEARLKVVEKKLEATAPKELPQGLGRLTFVLLMRELCNYQRFKNRRNVGGFTGLCGGVSSSGPAHQDLSINKAGSPYLRTLLVELAWRMTYWQPEYRGCQLWQRLCVGQKPAPKRRKKMAVVALAHQLAVDLWRWQTGQVTPQQLGWKMTQA